MHALRGYDFTTGKLLQRGTAGSVSSPSPFYSWGKDQIAHHGKSIRHVLTDRNLKGVKAIPDTYWTSGGNMSSLGVVPSYAYSYKSCLDGVHYYTYADLCYMVGNMNELEENKTSLFTGFIKNRVHYARSSTSIPPTLCNRMIAESMRSFHVFQSTREGDDESVVATTAADALGLPDDSEITEDEIIAAIDRDAAAIAEWTESISRDTPVGAFQNPDEDEQKEPKYRRLGIKSRDSLLSWLRRPFRMSDINRYCMDSVIPLNRIDNLLSEARLSFSEEVWNLVKFVMLKCTRKGAYVKSKTPNRMFWEDKSYDMRVLFDVNYIDGLYYGDRLINIRN